MGEHGHDEGEGAARREAVSARRARLLSVARAGAGLLVGAAIGMVVSAASLHAQDPWNTRLTATLAPVPIGGCGVVSVAIEDSTGRDAPRNPQGWRVSMADFDMTVQSVDPRALTGKYNGAASYSVCACQAATVGASATITATYPSRALAVKSRVAGVAYSVSIPITAGKAIGGGEPQGCPAQQTSVAVGSPIAATTRGVTPVGTVGAPPPTVPAGTGSVPMPPSVVAAGGPMTAAPPVARTGAPKSISSPAGPAPTNAGVKGTPAEAVVTWYPPSGVNGVAYKYVVERWSQANPGCCRAMSASIASQGGPITWHDPIQSSGTWIYRISTVYVDGRVGYVDVPYIYPDPEAPIGFSAKQLRGDTVMLSWQPVKNASYYAVAGPPANTSFRVDSTHTRIAGVPVGNQSWQLSTIYETATPGGPRAGSAFVSTSLTVSSRHYRIVAQSIRVNGETVDSQLSEDGKGDEVYVAAFGQVIDRTSHQLKQTTPIVISSVHGDVSSWPDRVKSGTRSGWGGLQFGDVVSPVVANGSAGMPGAGDFVLWDGVLMEGQDDLVLRPTLWEVDELESYGGRNTGAPCITAICQWGKFLTNLGLRSMSVPAVKAAFASPNISIAAGDQIWMTSSGYLVHIERQNRDRPIGLEIGSNADPNMGVEGMLRDLLVVLSREKIEAALAAGTNTVDVRFWEHWALNNVAPAKATTLGGDYVLTLRLERMP